MKQKVLNVFLPTKKQKAIIVLLISLNALGFTTIAALKYKNGDLVERSSFMPSEDNNRFVKAGWQVLSWSNGLLRYIKPNAQ